MSAIALANTPPRACGKAASSEQEDIPPAVPTALSAWDQGELSDSRRAVASCEATPVEITLFQNFTNKLHIYYELVLNKTQ